MKKHSKYMVIKVNGSDVSTYCQESEFERAKATHATTGYGLDDETYDAGLRSGKFGCGGVYDSTASTGPRALLKPLVESDTAATIIRRPEGTGTGLPQDSFSAQVTNYKESAPYNDMIKWSCDMQITGPVDSTAQS